MFWGVGVNVDTLNTPLSCRPPVSFHHIPRKDITSSFTIKLSGLRASAGSQVPWEHIRWRHVVVLICKPGLVDLLLE